MNFKTIMIIKMMITLKNYYTNFPQKKKSVVLLDIYNVDLMKYDNLHLTNEFLDSLSSHLFLLHITQPTGIRDSSKTLIDNIFSNTLM